MGGSVLDENAGSVLSDNQHPYPIRCEIVDPYDWRIANCVQNAVVQHPASLGCAYVVGVHVRLPGIGLARPDALDLFQFRAFRRGMLEGVLKISCRRLHFYRITTLQSCGTISHGVDFW